MTLQNKFEKWHDKHHNPLTPVLTDYYVINDTNMIVEIAESRHDNMQGVSVWEHTPDNELSEFTAVNHDLNKPFHDQEEAKEYALLLKQKLEDHAEIEEIINEVEK